MKKKRIVVVIAGVLVILSIATGTAFLLFGWMNYIIDSYFYLALVQYFKSGTYPFQAPFIYSKPTTISPPGYALLLLMVQWLPGPDVVLHLIQMLFLMGSSFLIYRMLRRQIGIAPAVVAACLYFLLPANLLYSSYMLTENGASFLVALFLFLLYRYETDKRPVWIGLTCLLGGVMTLWKYSLITFMAYAVLRFFRTRGKRPVHSVFLLEGLAIIALWISINYTITGRIGLSDTNGVQLWNQAVWIGKLLPSEQTPSMKTLREYIPPSVNLQVAYWDLQWYILTKTGNSWEAVDRLLGNVSRDALLQHPLGYTANTLNILFNLHKGRPYWHTLGRFGNNDPSYPLFCGVLWSFEFCGPVIRLPGVYGAWNAYVAGSTWFYEILFPILMLILFVPSILLLLAKGSSWERTLILLYGLGVVPIAMYVHPDPRYIIPFYPIIVLCIALGLRKLALSVNPHKQQAQTR